VSECRKNDVIDEVNVVDMNVVVSVAVNVDVDNEMCLCIVCLLSPISSSDIPLLLSNKFGFS